MTPRTDAAAIVCVHYHPHYVAPTLDLLDRVTEGLQVPARLHVANQEAAAQALLAGLQGRDAMVVRHDNRGLEFGGYQAGVDALLAEHDPDWLLVFNDTFATHDNFATPYRARLRGELWNRREHPTIVGQLETSRRSFGLAGLRTNRWVRSNVFALNRAALATLDRRLYVPALDAAVRETAEAAEFFGPEVDAVLAAHLRAWLFEPSGPGARWYGAAPLGAGNAAAMARKARSILQEKYLSARLEEAGAEFVDVRDIGVAARARRRIEDKLFDARRRRRAPTGATPHGGPA